MTVGGPCSIEGCTRARMYNSPVCYTHKDKAEDVSWGEMERGHGQERGAEIKVYSIKEQVGFVIILFGLIVALIGVFWMFGDYLGAQMAGSFLLLIGGLTASIGVKLFGSDKIDLGSILPDSTSVTMRHRLLLILCFTIFSYGFYVYQGAI